MWTLLRLAPEGLPTGSSELVPGSMLQRLRHQPWQPRRAEATLTRHPDAPALRTCSLTYPDLGRTLAILFQAAFPQTTGGWEESYRSGRGPDAKALTTRTSQKTRWRLDYWSHRDLDDQPLRVELGLDDPSKN